MLTGCAGWEGFVAVQEGNFWAIYYDVDNDRLGSKVSDGRAVLEIELRRVEMRVTKPAVSAGDQPNGRSEQQSHQSEIDLPVKLESPDVD